MTVPITSASRAPRVLTVGAGASPLAGALLETGHYVIAVDIAAAALDALVASVGAVGAADASDASDASDRLTTLVADVRTLVIDEPVEVWHDRAVFHFLVAADDRAAYAHAAARALKPGGHLLIATFAPSGPDTCSGLPVQRHDAASLATAFAADFDLIDSFEDEHTTPWETTQRFTHAVLQRR